MEYIDGFDKIKVIFESSKTTVSKVKRISDGKTFALKVTQKEENAMRNAIKEATLLRKLNEEKCPNIIQFLSIVYVDGSSYLFTEFYDGLDLRELISKKKKEQGRFALKEWQKIIGQICTALKFLHSGNFTSQNFTIIHRDIKPTNIFLDADNNAKLGDFGCARQYLKDGPLPKCAAGSRIYKSPESLFNIPQGTPTDIFSLGCTLYEMCTLTRPIKLSKISAKSEEEICNEINENRFQLGLRFLEKQVKILICNMTEQAPEDRPTASDILLQLEGHQ